MSDYMGKKTASLAVFGVGTGAGERFWPEPTSVTEFPDPRAPSATADPSALLPWVDKDHVDGLSSWRSSNLLANHDAAAGSAQANVGVSNTLRDVNDVEVSTMITSLRAAQHALDAALGQHDASGEHDVSLVTQAAMAFTHLEHASNSRERSGTRRHRDHGLVEAANQFSLSLDEFSDKAFGVPRLSELAILNAYLRKELGLAEVAPLKARTREVGSGSAYAKNALADTLDMITHHARATYTTLLAHGDRNVEPPADSVTSQIPAHFTDRDRRNRRIVITETA